MDKILLLEDDVSLIDGLTYSLQRQGYEIDVLRSLRRLRFCPTSASMFCCFWMSLCRTERGLKPANGSGHGIS